MARLYGAASTDRVTFTQGSGFTGLNNLAQGNFTAIAVGRRTQNNQMYLMSKTPGTTAGWEFMNGGWVGGTTNGHLRILVWTSGTRYDFQSGTAEGVDISVLNQHELWAVTWNGTTKTPVFYRNAIQTPVVATSGPTTVVAGSGTLGSDAGTSFTGWNNTRALTTPMLGDGSWLILFNRVLSQAEIQDVQAGVLMYRAGVEAASAATKTRGVNLIKSVSGFLMINYQDSTGACTEFSGNDITGANTGTITAGAESANWFAPSVFEDDLETTLSEQTTYRYTSPFARWTAQTTADGFVAWQRTTLDPATYPNQAVLGYDVNGVRTGKLSSATLNTGSTTAAYNTSVVSGLGASSKAISFLNGTRSHPVGVPAPYQGTFLTLVQFTAAATETAPPARAKPSIWAGDSGLFGGFLADDPQRYTCQQVLRRALPSWIDAVITDGAGGEALYDLCKDSTTRTATLARWFAGGRNPRVINIGLMANDVGRDYWASATAKTALVALLDGAMPSFSGIFRLYGMYPTTNEAFTSPTYGENYATWRTMLASVPAACAIPSRVQFIDTVTDPWNNTTTDLADSVHANNTGHQKFDARIATLFAAAPRLPQRLLSHSVGRSGSRRAA